MRSGGSSGFSRALLFIIGIVIIAAALLVGYNLGSFFTSKDNQTNIVENYSFVRDIAELASLEVIGTTTTTSTNVANNGSFTDDLKKIFIENTVRLTAPYRAKYGIDLQDSSMRIERNDSVLKIYLPPPKLLSYEIYLDRLEATNRKGWFRFEDEAAYSKFQKKMYAESRVVLEKNEVYLNRSRDKICNIIQKYFLPLHVKTVCIYDVSLLKQNKPN